MNFGYRLGGVLAVLAFGTTLLAQTGSPPTLLQQTYTTGMVGFTTNQTARLNVLNLNSGPVSTSPQSPSCSVELQFFDDKNTLIKQTTVTNFAPGASTLLDLPRASVTSATAASRAQIRGVVVVNGALTPSGMMNALGFCTVFTTLEVFDVNGSTVSMTSDTRSVHASVVPVAVGRN